MARTICVFLVYASVPARMGIWRILESSGGFEIVGECGDAATALSLIKLQIPDVIVLDCRLPDASGMEIATELRR